MPDHKVKSIYDKDLILRTKAKLIYWFFSNMENDSKIKEIGSLDLISFIESAERR